VPRSTRDVTDHDSTEVLSCWEYIGSGYLNPGDAQLAAGVEAAIRVGREALLDLRPGPARPRGSRMKASLPTDCHGNADPRPELSNHVGGNFRLTAGT
jgi:hypothetical protein